MCIKEKDCCIVISHAIKAEFVPQIESRSGKCVLIGVSGTSEQVYLSNIVPLESFKADLKTYLYESLDEWDHLFSTIKAGTLNQEEIVLVANEASAVVEERQINGGLVLPRKRSVGEMVMQQLEAEYNTFGSFIATRTIKGGDLQSSNNLIDNLQHQMNFLAKKVKKTEVSQLTFPPDEADRSIVGLQNLVGSRPEGISPVLIMESMHQLAN
jgi:hypothetical protein